MFLRFDIVHEYVFLKSNMSRITYFLAVIFLASNVHASLYPGVPVLNGLEWSELTLDEPVIDLETIPVNKTYSAVAIAGASNNILKIENITMFSDEENCGVTTEAVNGCGTELRSSWTRRWGPVIAAINCQEETPLFSLVPSLRLVHKLPFPSSDIALWERFEDKTLAIAAITPRGLEAMALRDSASETAALGTPSLGLDSESFTLLPPSLHRLPLGQLTHFRISRRNFITILPEEGDAYPGVIVLAEDANGDLRRFQRLSVPNPITGVTHFSFSSREKRSYEHLLLISTHFPENSPEDQASIVFKFEDGCFVPFQSFLSPQPHKFIVLTGEAAVLAAWGQNGLTMLQYDGWRLVPVKKSSEELKGKDLEADNMETSNTMSATESVKTADMVESVYTSSSQTNSQTTNAPSTSYMLSSTVTAHMKTTETSESPSVADEENPRMENLDIRFGSQEQQLRVLSSPRNSAFAIVDQNQKKTLNLYRPKFKKSMLFLNANSEARTWCEASLRETHEAIKMFKSVAPVVPSGEPLTDAVLLNAFFHQCCSFFQMFPSRTNAVRIATNPRMAMHKETQKRPLGAPTKSHETPLQEEVSLSPSTSPDQTRSDNSTNHQSVDAYLNALLPKQPEEHHSTSTQKQTDTPHSPTQNAQQGWSQEQSTTTQRTQENFQYFPTALSNQSDTAKQNSQIPEPGFMRHVTNTSRQHAADQNVPQNDGAPILNSCKLEDAGWLEGVEQLTSLDNELAAITVDHRFNLVKPNSAGSFLNHTYHSVFRLKDHGMRISEFSRIDLCSSPGVYIEATGGGRTVGQAHAVENGVVRLVDRVGVGEKTKARGVCYNGHQCFLLHPKAQGNCAIQCHHVVTHFPCASHPDKNHGNFSDPGIQARIEYDGIFYRLASNKDATLLCRYKSEGIFESCEEIAEAAGAYQVALAKTEKQLVALAMTSSGLVVQAAGAKVITQPAKNATLQVLYFRGETLIALRQPAGVRLYFLKC